MWIALKIGMQEQFHYEKVNGERPGKKYGKTLSPLTVAKGTRHSEKHRK